MNPWEMNWKKASPLDVAIAAEGVPPDVAAVAKSIYQQETTSGTNVKRSDAGAVGGMQMMPATFRRFAEKGWNIHDPVENARAALRYLKTLSTKAGGNAKLMAVGYYGGEGAIDKARRGIAVRDPRNPEAPNTFQYANKVASRLPKGGSKMPWQMNWSGDASADDQQVAQPQPTKPPQPAQPPVSVAEARTDSFLHGIKDPFTGGAQLLTHILPQPVVDAGNRLNNWLAQYHLVDPIPKGGLDQMVQQDEASLAHKRQAAGLNGTDWSRIAGNVASPANWALAAGAPVPLSTLGKVAVGAGQGMASSALSPVTSGDFWTEKGKQVALGGALGAATPVVGNALAGFIKPNVSPEVAMLKKAGVSMTPGQMMGGGWRATEEKLSSLPLVGDIIKSAELRGIQSFNRATINQALDAIGEKLPKNLSAGHEAIDYAAEKIGQRYGQLLPKLKGVRDKPFTQEINNIKFIGKSLPKDKSDQLNRIIDNEVLKRFSPGGLATGRMLKDIESKLGREASVMARSDDYDTRNMADALKEVQATVRRMIERNNPQHRDELQKINSAYSKFLRVQDAAGRVGAREGIYTPSQLKSAVRAGDASKRKAAFARGKASMQDIATAGEKVLSKKVPDSGTAGRAIVGALALGSPGLAHPMMGLGAISSLLYTPIGQQAVQAALTARPKLAAPIAKAIRNHPQALGALTIPLSQLANFGYGN